MVRRRRITIQLTHEFLAGREKLFTDRIAAGRIVDGHGDLIGPLLVLKRRR